MLEAPQIAANTPAQANPYATSMNLLNQAQKGQIENRYLPANLLARNIYANLQNRMLAPQAQAEPQMVQAQLAQAQAQAPYLQAQTQGITQGQIPLQQAQGGYYGAEAAMTNQQVPYAGQRAQTDAYSSPIVKRISDLVYANQNPQMAQKLNQYGLNPQNAQQQNQQGQNAPAQNVMPNLYRSLQGAQQSGGQHGSPQMPQMPQAQQPQMPGYGNSQGNTQNSGFVMPPIVPINQTASPMTNPNVYSGSPDQNLVYTGEAFSPTQMAQFKAYGKGLDTQASTAVTSYNDLQKDAGDYARVANTITQNLKGFQDSYAKSKLKGGQLGSLPTTGLESLPSKIYANLNGQSDLSNEQLTDKYAGSLAGLFTKELFGTGGKMTNMELSSVQGWKPSRKDDPDAANNSAQFLSDVSSRLKEYQPFLNATREAGIPAQTAQTLWETYQRQRIPYDTNSNQSNENYKDSWRDFATPQAAQAINGGQTYVPIPKGFKSPAQFKAWQNNLTPQELSQARPQVAYAQNQNSGAKQQ